MHRSARSGTSHASALWDVVGGHRHRSTAPDARGYEDEQLSVPSTVASSPGAGAIVVLIGRPLALAIYWLALARSAIRPFHSKFYRPCRAVSGSFPQVTRNSLSWHFLRQVRHGHAEHPRQLRQHAERRIRGGRNTGILSGPSEIQTYLSCGYTSTQCMPATLGSRVSMAHRGNGCLKQSCGITSGNISRPMSFLMKKALYPYRWHPTSL